MIRTSKVVLEIDWDDQLTEDPKLWNWNVVVFGLFDRGFDDDERDAISDVRY